MATATRTTASAIASSLRTTYTTPLLTEIVAGKIIEASHMTMIGNFINEMPVHNHAFTEYSSIGEFGNTGKTATINRNTNNGPGSGTLITVPTPAVGSTIFASITNTLVGGVNGIRSHTHTFNDENGQ
jgi:hypothetical protein